MSGNLADLTETDVSARCTEASLDRGWSYYKGGAVQQRVRLDDGIATRVSGTHLYSVSVREAYGGLTAYCSCPYDWGGDCKHIVATLLAWLHEPESFRDRADLQAAIAAREKEELVVILMDLCTLYPHLVDEFGLLGEAADYDPEAVVREILGDLLPPGEISVGEAVARMESVARHAARLAGQGQGELARRAYYALTRNCVEFCEDYGADGLFPLHIPYDFAVAYRGLALEQLEEHVEAIENELRSMLGGWASEMLGVEEPLREVWDALGL